MGHTLSSKVLLSWFSVLDWEFSVFIGITGELSKCWCVVHLREYLIELVQSSGLGGKFSKFLSCFSYVVKLESLSLRRDHPSPGCDSHPSFAKSLIIFIPSFSPSDPPCKSKQANKKTTHNITKRKQKTLPNTLPASAAECGPKSPVGPSTASLLLQLIILNLLFSHLLRAPSPFCTKLLYHFKIRKQTGRITLSLHRNHILFLLFAPPLTYPVDRLLKRPLSFLSPKCPTFLDYFHRSFFNNLFLIGGLLLNKVVFVSAVQRKSTIEYVCRHVSPPSLGPPSRTSLPASLPLLGCLFYVL